MNEHTYARQWRERMKLSRMQLAELSGYSYESICLFEQGKTPRRTWKARAKSVTEPGAIDPYVWLRYKRVCQGVNAELNGNTFAW